jgi:hypothetical protein
MAGLHLSAPDQQAEVERRRALRALLVHPILSAGANEEDFKLVRRHSQWLKHWFMEFPGWSLHIDKELARLHKTPADVFDLDDTRPAIDRASGTPFSRRRYAVLCLTLAALDQPGRHTTLVRIAQAIVELVSSDGQLNASGMNFDVANHDHRRDLVHVVRYLSEMGALLRMDGDEQQFLNRSADVLYEINHRILAVFAPQADSRVDRIRTSLIRALLDDPILYFDEMDDATRAYFERHRGHLLREVEAATGLIAEVRREGVAMVDDSGDLTDIKLHEEDTEGLTALRLVQSLTERYRPDAVVPVLELAQEAGVEMQMAADALSRLRALRLVRLSESGVVPMAACWRYASLNEE